MNEINPSEFTAILHELTHHPLPVNKYRPSAGNGISQAFGIVNKRCLPPGPSRQNWLRPYLYKLLLDFGAKYVDISWNAITVNQNYKAAPHRDKQNIGDSYLVAFGDYQGGELEFHEGEKQGLHNINCRPILHNFSKDLHSVKDFTGTRISLVYYNFDTRGRTYPPESVQHQDGRWIYIYDGKPITKKEGMPHPLRGRKKVGHQN